jgi:S-formylglutathione hydrolase FrmB
VGGYAALNITLHHLGLFSVAECWSGYFRQMAAGPFAHASAAQLRYNSPADQVAALAPQIRRLGMRAWLYQGIEDAHNPANIRDFSAQLAAAGATVHYGFFRGGHDWSLWRAQAPRMLIAAGQWFQRRPAGHAHLSSTGHALSRAQLARITRARLRRCLHLRRGQRVGLTCRAYRLKVLGHP